MSKISIILPTYNVEKYIARALHTCINQTFKDIEIIVVDDCGEDKSIAIAKEYAKQDSRIKIIHNEKNLGVFASRNVGVLRAKSQFLMFLDPDDYLELDACKICSLYFDKNFDFIWFNLKFDNKLQEKPLKDLFLTHEEYIKYTLVGNISYLWNICSKLISKRTYEQALNMLKSYCHCKLNMAEDALMYYFIVLNSKYIITSSKIIYNYMRNDTSITQSKDLKLIKQGIDDEKMIISIILNYLNHHVLNNVTYIFSKSILCKMYIANTGKQIDFYRKKNYILYKLFYKLRYKNQQRIYKIKQWFYLKQLMIKFRHINI